MKTLIGFRLVNKSKFVAECKSDADNLGAHERSHHCKNIELATPNDALTAFADPFALEETWTSAYECLCAIYSGKVLRKPKSNKFADSCCGLVAGLLLTALAANCSKTLEYASLLFVLYIFLVYAALSYLLITNSAGKSRFLLVLSWTLAISFGLLILLSPHDSL